MGVTAPLGVPLAQPVEEREGVEDDPLFR